MNLTTALWFSCALTVVGAPPTAASALCPRSLIQSGRPRSSWYETSASSAPQELSRLVLMVFRSLDGVPVYGIDAGEDVILHVPAGEHVVAATESLAIDRSMMLDAQPGRRYYVRLQPMVGDGTLPTPVAAPQGEELLTKTTRVE